MSKKIRDSAKGVECQIRLPNHCNRDNATVVLCHLNGAGLSIKKPDMLGAYGCSSCHDAIDGRTQTLLLKDDLELAHRQGVERTQLIMIDNGLIGEL